MTNSATYLSELHQLLNQHFNLAEIRTLCLDLNVDYESIAGEEKPSRIRELLLALARNGRLAELITIVQQQRPLTEWPRVPDDFKLPELLDSGTSGTARPKVDQLQVVNIHDGFGLAIDQGAQVNINVIERERPAKKKPFLPYEPETVEVAAGPFLMGDNDDPLAAPQHTVELPTYRIGMYPVTNEQFEQFIRQTGRVASSELLWEGNKPPPSQLNYPVTGVTWYEAIAYCNWLTGETERPYRLPSEAQWEKAARGKSGLLYPWGNEWDPSRCHADLAKLSVVDAFPAQTPYGCYDMVGNAREWTTTMWGDSPREPDKRFRYPWANDGRNDLSGSPTMRRVFRGGRGNAPASFRCSVRGAFLPNRTGPRQQRHGFRVALLLSG